MKLRRFGERRGALVVLSTLPTRNFREGTFEGAVELSAERATELREKTRTHCASCTIGCGHIYPTEHPQVDDAICDFLAGLSA